MSKSYLFESEFNILKESWPSSLRLVSKVKPRGSSTLVKTSDNCAVSVAKQDHLLQGHATESSVQIIIQKNS